MVDSGSIFGGSPEARAPFPLKSGSVEMFLSVEDDLEAPPLASASSRPEAVIEKFLISIIDLSPSLTTALKPNTTLKHPVRHYSLHTNGAPVYCKPHRLSPEMLKAVKAKFNEMFEQGFIEK